MRPRAACPPWPLGLRTSGKSKPVDFANDGIACQVANLAGNCRGAVAFGPQGFQLLNAIICPAHDGSPEMKSARRGGRALIGRWMISRDGWCRSAIGGYSAA